MNGKTWAALVPPRVPTTNARQEGAPKKDHRKYEVAEPPASRMDQRHRWPPRWGQVQALGVPEAMAKPSPARWDERRRVQHLPAGRHDVEGCFDHRDVEYTYNYIYMYIYKCIYICIYMAVSCLSCSQDLHAIFYIYIYIYTYVCAWMLASALK